jgi:YrbI family 3-deoxy-D-manno-octulosonate 8-phosphate phosphatase
MNDKKMIVISDVDGCLTDGKYVYTVDGKIAKTFGPHDNDGVKLLRKNGIDVRFISADRRGFPITKKRIEDMKCEIDYVSEADRADYLQKFCDDARYSNGVVFFGDGLGDLAAAKRTNAILIAPANARPEVKAYARIVTANIGGEGAFLDLADYVTKHAAMICNDEIVELD